MKFDAYFAITILLGITCIPVSAASEYTWLVEPSSKWDTIMDVNGDYFVAMKNGKYGVEKIGVGTVLTYSYSYIEITEDKRDGTIITVFCATLQLAIMLRCVNSRLVSLMISQKSEC